jgi:hypothetical protein
MFATVRTVIGANHLDQIDFANRVARMPVTLDGMADPSIFSNVLSSPDGALAESTDHDVLQLVLPDGNVAEYDASVQAWVPNAPSCTP